MNDKPNQFKIALKAALDEVHFNYMLRFDGGLIFGGEEIIACQHCGYNTTTNKFEDFHHYDTCPIAIIKKHLTSAIEQEQNGD